MGRLVEFRIPRAPVTQGQLLDECERELAAFFAALDEADEQARAALDEIKAARARRRAKSKGEAKMTRTEDFSFTLGSTAEARELKPGTWEATIGDAKPVRAATAEAAIWKAEAAYMRAAADRIEKTGKL